MNPEGKFIALDLETTGLDIEEEEIIEVGMVLFDEGKTIERYSKTVNPGKIVSDTVQIITGIDQDELNESPPVEEILPEIKEFIEDFPVIGHNISFDISFIEKHFTVDNNYYDTLILSQIYLPFVRSHKLTYIADYLSIDYEDAHRALEDAEVSGRILTDIFNIMCSVNPRILKKQSTVLKNKHPESEIIDYAIKESLRRGLNRGEYPLDIPVNFRQGRDEGNGEFRDNIKDYFESEILESRPSQIKMAELVDITLKNDEFLLVEASAGTGKSLAYLIPSILHAKLKDEPIYISSYTKNLQQQLFNNDIPQAEKITGFEVNTLLRKGRSNYLCTDKLKRLPGDLNPVILSAIYLWSELTETGDLSEISYVFREINIGLLNMDESCRKSLCPFYEDCYYYKMRKRVNEADLILVNHALFFTGNPQAERVIFDEAHEIERAATDGYSIKIGHSDVQSILNGISREIDDSVLLGKIRKLKDISEDAFEKAGRSVAEENEYMVGTYRNARLSPLRSLNEQLEGLSNALKDTEIEEDIIIGLKDTIINLKTIINQDVDEMVFYSVLPNRNRLTSLELIGAPLDVGSYLEEFLYPSLKAMIMSSATLSVGESFDFIRYILGLTGYSEKLTEISLPDTYNFEEQALTIIPRYLSHPNSPSFIEEVGQFIKDIVIPQERGTLVLFTSYNHMKGVYNNIKKEFDNRGRELLIQGFGKSRSKLLSIFKEKKGSILLGTGSFWQGVDVPGKSLEIVVIEKLPFPNPSEPFIAAKSSYLEREGLGGFSSYMLPLSVLRFKQGFGRLIRSTRDMGVIIILDRRITEKSYGSVFIDSLPTKISIVNSSLEASEAVRLWFDEGKTYISESIQDDWETY